MVVGSLGQPLHPYYYIRGVVNIRFFSYGNYDVVYTACESNLECDVPQTLAEFVPPFPEKAEACPARPYSVTCMRTRKYFFIENEVDRCRDLNDSSPVVPLSQPPTRFRNLVVRTYCTS